MRQHTLISAILILTICFYTKAFQVTKPERLLIQRNRANLSQNTTSQLSVNKQIQLAQALSIFHQTNTATTQLLQLSKPVHYSEFAQVTTAPAAKSTTPPDQTAAEKKEQEEDKKTIDKAKKNVDDSYKKREKTIKDALAKFEKWIDAQHKSVYDAAAAFLKIKKDELLEEQKKAAEDHQALIKKAEDTVKTIKSDVASASLAQLKILLQKEHAYPQMVPQEDKDAIINSQPTNMPDVYRQYLNKGLMGDITNGIGNNYKLDTDIYDDIITAEGKVQNIFGDLQTHVDKLEKKKQELWKGVQNKFQKDADKGLKNQQKNDQKKAKQEQKEIKKEGDKPVTPPKKLTPSSPEKAHSMPNKSIEKKNPPYVNENGAHVINSQMKKQLANGIDFSWMSDIAQKEIAGNKNLAGKLHVALVKGNKIVAIHK